MSVPRSTPRRRLTALAGVTSVLLLATMLSAGPAPAQVACDTSTITIVPQDDLTPGVTGDGVTTLAANTAAPFDFEVVGTIPDGWMLGLDAIVIHITGPTEFLDETGGVFFGMSGSPAYVGGDLAGAVSGVFWDDPTFGVLTPAQAMLDVMDAAQPPAPLAQKIVPTDAVRRSMARIQGESVSSVTGSFQQLPTPLAVSGLSRRQAAELQARLDERGENFWVYRAASAKTTANAALDPTPFAPGETLGAAVSYGDASYYATGTATFICGDYVAAFGHPFFYDAPGEISLGLSGAEGLMVLKPLGYPGYRYALLTEPRGTIVQDRFAGIVGLQGVAPPSVPVTSDLENLDEGNTRLGTTEAIHTWGWWLEEIVWAHLWSNFAATFGHYGGGTSRLDWTLTGHTASGPFTVTDFSMASSPWDVTDSMWPLISSIDALQFNEFEEVTFDGVATTGWVTKDRLEGTIGQVLLSSTSFPTPKETNVIRARPGDVVTIAITFDMLEGGTQPVIATLTVPKRPSKNIEIKMRGGRDRSRYWDAGSFDELLDLLQAKEHTNDLVITGIRPTQRLPQEFVVGGKDRFYVRTKW
ncbi:MAG TPA: SpoIVB peptidase S55 domain-containing protein [Actinomycetota bacterium]|nr:SpoIVB peptidase S55 domain-containing protein [Actinomycetota bacterium]